MKISPENFKKYLLLLIMLIPVLIFAIFFSNYYSIYRDLTNPSVHNPAPDIIVRNPFEDIEAIEENEENMQEDKNLTIGRPGFPNEPGGSVETNSPNDTPPVKSMVPSNPNNVKTNFPNNTEKSSYNYIMGIYKSRFEKLQREQEGKLYSLVDEAIAEYIKNGSKRSLLLSMAPKYMNLANSMERQANKEVDMLIGNLKIDLINNSYETDITEEIRDYYNYYKKVFKAQIIKEGTKYL